MYYVYTLCMFTCMSPSKGHQVSSSVSLGFIYLGEGLSPSLKSTLLVKAGLESIQPASTEVRAHLQCWGLELRSFLVLAQQAPFPTESSHQPLELIFNRAQWGRGKDAILCFVARPFKNLHAKWHFSVQRVPVFPI